MSNRTHRSNRCPTCRMREDLCFCAELRPIHTKTKVSVVMHCAEAGKPTNTARLMHLLLPNSELHVVGRLNAPHDLSSMIAPDTHPLMLFPEASAPLLDSEFRDALGKPVTLVVPDGTWKQARKLAHHLPELQSLPRIQLPPGGPTRYLVRQHQHEGGVCTIEAIARALEVLEGIEVRRELDRFLDIMVERVLWSRRTSQRFRIGDLV